MKKGKTQSSQKTTLMSFFKVKPLKEITDVNVCSQASVDSGHSSDFTPEKHRASSNVPDKSQKNDIHAIKVSPKSKVLAKSPKKRRYDKLIKSPNCKYKELSKAMSPVKSQSSTLVAWLSPKKSVDSDNACLKFRDIADISPSNVISENNKDETVLRRSPRKHPTSPPSLIKVKQKSPSDKTQPIQNEDVILLDETDDALFANFVSPVKTIELEQKKRFRSCSQSPPAGSTKKQRSLHFSPMKSNSETIQLKKKDSLNLQDEEGVNLSQSSRCRVSGISTSDEGDISLSLLCLRTNALTSCTLQFPWNGLPVSVGDLVCVKATKNEEGKWFVAAGGDNWFVLHADMLISCTTVVGSLFCKRRSVLSHIFKEISTDSQASAMYVGIIVHQLLQQALKMELKTLDEVQKLFNQILNSQDFVKSVYLQGMDLHKIRETTLLYLPRICQFIEDYVSTISKSSNDSKDWPGKIIEVKDIEENVWIPHFGLKGKIDATVKVNIHSKTRIMPLELKTGKPSNSVEHRGQVILYCMMLNQLGYDSVDSGLLLYLKDYVLKEVKGGDAEKRDLIMLRNELASRINQAHISSQLEGTLSLPDPIDRKSVCLSCPQLIPCTATLRVTGNTYHPLSKLVPEKTSHLSDAHLKYIYHWLRLVTLESNQSKKCSPIWANSVHIREEEGSCLSDLKISSYLISNNFKVETTFTRDKPLKEGVFEEGQYVVVSNDNQVALACGHVLSVSSSQVKLLLDRDLNKFPSPFHIDRYEGSYSASLLTSFLSVLLGDSAKALFLRKHIVDKELPKFVTKLSSKIKVKCREVFTDINRDQVRALLQVLSADSFILIKGMPGTGKSRTVGALIEVLSLLGHSILLTSHTHSAVDNILMKLSKSLTDKVLRLGSAKRVHPDVVHLTESHQLSKLPAMNSDQISDFYNSKTIVGVTCLGAVHQLLSRREFDYCIVDEATQVCQPEALAALYASKKFVLIGDPNQLPPLVISEEAKELGMSVSLLEHLDRPAVTTSLTLQYRMNQVITGLANNFTYNNLLKCATDSIATSSIQTTNKIDKNTCEWLKKICSSEILDSVVAVDVAVPDLSNHNVNEVEANIVLKALWTLKKVGISPPDVGVITPYRGQVSFIRKLLKEDFNDVEVSTVDQFQGRDKSVILFSAARNKPMVPGSNDILGDKNRLTVTITRAKHKLVVIGNVGILNTYPTFKSLFSFFKKSNIIKISADEV